MPMPKPQPKPELDATSVARRTWPLEVEYRTDGDGMHFSGYAAVFNSNSEPLPFIESIAPGAFTHTLNNHKRDVRMFLNHNSDMILGRVQAGTLRLKEDNKGLLVDADLPDTTYARDLSVSMRRGDVDQMSFGFSVPKDKDSWDGNHRTLHEVNLFEVSVVTGFPAYTATAAQVRRLDHEQDSRRIWVVQFAALPVRPAQADARAKSLAEVRNKLGDEPIVTNPDPGTRTAQSATVHGTPVGKSTPHLQ